MKIDIVSSMGHYHRHILPIFDALPEALKGDGSPGRAYPDPGNVALVASWVDLEPLRANHEYFYVEHGAGQAYPGDVKSAAQPGYSGSGGVRHVGCLGFICPSQTVADRWTTAPSIAVGCPKLDKYARLLNPHISQVCLAFHWDCPISPEARSAWAHYNRDLDTIADQLRRQGFTPHAHAHPKWHHAITAALVDAGFEFLESEEEVFERCGSLIMDSSSLMYEFAALDRPVIALDAPWYRQDVEHGLRFWAYVPGPRMDCPYDLWHYPFLSRFNADYAIERRRSAAAYAYAHRDGSSSQRAADFVVGRLRELGRV